MSDPAPTAGTEGVRIRGDGYTAEAGWFGPEDRPRFGWLYHPDKMAENRVGIVIVPPFGREDICAHRTLRHLAEDSAKAGFVAVRFDLDGTGDSSGDDTDPDRVGAWLANIHDACDLSRGAGANQLVLVGVRLGATLAALSAPGRSDIAALIAFNAVISGKAYLRELRALQIAMNLQPAPEPVADMGQETSGFLLATATCETLKAVDLAAADIKPAPRVVLLERDDMPERKGWPDRLRALGIDVHVQRIPGYVDMMNDPHASRVSQTFIDICTGVASGLPRTPEQAQPSGPPTSLRPRIQLRVDGTAIVEEVVQPTHGTFGILARSGAGSGERAVLMLNAGAIRRIGSNRIDVPLARQLATRGLQVLRIDLPGIGDSPPHQGEAENIVYGPHCVSDVGKVVAWLRACGVRDLAVGGMCSGAYHALRAAIAGQAIDDTFLINCLVYSREVNSDPEAGALFGDITHYNQAMKSSSAWRRLLAGKVAFGAVARVLFWHIGNRLARAYKNLMRMLRIPMSDDLGSDLEVLARRGIKTQFLFSANEAGQSLLVAEAGAVLSRLIRNRKIHIRVFDGADHTFTQRWAQTMLHAALMDALTNLSPPDHRTPHL